MERGRSGRTETAVHSYTQEVYGRPQGRSGVQPTSALSSVSELCKSRGDWRLSTERIELSPVGYLVEADTC